MNICNLFISAAEKYPNKIAIIHGDEKITYGNLLEEVKKTAGYFSDKGIVSGDRVLVFIPMGIPLYRTVLALFYIGASAVFLDEWVSAKRLAVCCKLADCKGFIGVRKAQFLSLFLGSLRRIPIKLKMAKRGKALLNCHDVNEESTALITFTTGSTGIPKAADRSHAFLNEQFKALLDEINPKERDIDLTTLPIVLFVNLGVGCTSVITDFKISKPEKLNLSKLRELLVNANVNRLISSPFLIKKLSEHVVNSKTEIPSVEQIFTGGAPVFPSDSLLFKRAFPTSKINLVYGSTECEPISSIQAVDLNRSEGGASQGLPVGDIYHKTRLKIIKISEEVISINSENEFDSLRLNENEIGEIIVEGPHVLKRYFKNDQAFSENKIVIGNEIWHRTGDSGFLNDGRLFLTGRCSQLIYHRQEIISPFISENTLNEIKGVEIGTLLKIKDSLILAVETDLRKEQLIDILQDKIKFDKVLMVNKIPRDPRHNSKIDYKKLEKSLLNKLN